VLLALKAAGDDGCLLRTYHEEVEHSYDGANKDHLLYDAVLGL
jgi:hypothetical protein